MGDEFRYTCLLHCNLKADDHPLEFMDDTVAYKVLCKNLDDFLS